MKNLFLTLVALCTLLLTACSSCLGTTPTPGKAAPQAEASGNIQSTVDMLDSLLQAGDGAQFYAVLANVPEKLMDESDSMKVQTYVSELHEFLTTHQEPIAAMAGRADDPVTKEELPKLVAFFSDSEQLQAFYGVSCP